MKIVVPTYNTEAWIERCLSTIYKQRYNHFECVVINDASTDKTKEILDSLEFLEKDPRFSVIHNEKNVKALKNIVDGFNFLKTKDDPEAVLMVIDGDDFLFTDYSLAIIADVYDKHNPMLTYGNHVHHPTGGMSNCFPLPPEVIQKNAFREYKFVTSHLRTFRSKLWHAIKDEDLRDEDGKYFSVGWDVAFMLPMLEMSRERTLFVPNIVYCYNRFNPISDDQIRQEDQHRVEMLVRKRKKYERFPGPPPKTPLQFLKEIQGTAVKEWVKKDGDNTLRLNYDLNSDSTVIDVGGFKGEWAQQINDKYNCEIHVYEPFEKFSNLLKEKFNDKPNIKVYNLGIGGTTRKVKMIEDDLATRVVDDPNGNISLVSVTKALENFNTIDLLKMNIEGSEYEVLPAMISSGDINKVKNLQVQFHPIDDDSIQKYEKIRGDLEKTHELTYFFPFIWENWAIK